MIKLIVIYFHSLPYCEAALREVLRFETLVQSNIGHKALEDTQFQGYTIPKVYTILTSQEIKMIMNLIYRILLYMPLCTQFITRKKYGETQRTSDPNDSWMMMENYV